MNKLLIAGACIALLSACDQAPEEVAPLVSGIEFGGFDTDVRAQDDFGQYVNGTWLRETEIPGDFSSWGSFATLFSESEEAQRAIIEELGGQTDLAEGSEEQKVGALFASYMDEERANALGVTPLAGILGRVDAVSNKSEWAALVGELARYGVQSPVAMMVDQNASDSTKYVAIFWQSGLGLPNRDYYTREGEKFDLIRSRYPEYIATLFSLAGIEAGAERAQAVYSLEAKIAEQHLPPEETREADKNHNLYAVGDLSGLADALDWNAYLAGRGLSGQAQVDVGQPSYVEGLGDILEETSLDDLKAYTAFKVINSSANLLSEPFVTARFEFASKLINGTEEQPARWKRGVRTVNAYLGEALGKVYVDRHFPPEAKERMDLLVANLIDEFGIAINELSWMGEDTKEKAQDKRRKFTTKIGYPDEWRDYSGLEISRDDLFGNVMAGRRFDYQRDLDKLGKPIDRGEWHMTPQTVNAYHNPPMNEIVFPAAILQPPFFNLVADDAVNYGGIGGVIGHEIGHAFDDQGRKYDGQGNLNDWWTEGDTEAFTASAQKLVEYYNQFSPLEGLNVNGQLTLGENIGDLTGLILGYRAYKRSLNGEEAPVLDGFTGEQRFFIGWAQVWRTKRREALMRRIVISDPHSPAQFRINGPLKHVPEFYEAFDVKEGDAMYLSPEERVKIW